MLRARLSLACGQWSVQFAPRARRARAMAALNGASRNKIRFYNITPAPGACPWAWIALEEKRLSYDVQLEDTSSKTGEFNSLYHSLWPDETVSSKVPTLIDTNGTKVTESSVVVEYLDAAYPDSGPRLVPSSPADAASARLFSNIFQSSFLQRFVALGRAEKGEELESAKADFTKGLAVLDRYLKQNAKGNGPWLLQDYSIAEVLSAPFVASAAKTLPEFKHVSPVELAREQGLVAVAAWIEGILERPSTKATALSDEDILRMAEKRMVRSPA